MPNVFPSNIVLNVVFYVLFVGILNFLKFFHPEFFKVKMAQRCWSAPDPLPPVYLCLAAPLRHCPFDSLLHSPTEPRFVHFCEQKQRISGAVAHCSTWNTVHFVNRSSESVEQLAHCSTWNTVHFVNRSSEAMEQRPSVSRSIPPCMRVWIGAAEASTMHRCALNRCAIRRRRP